jgi:hypothetical protein
MATFDEIKKIRLTINDPAGVINIVQIATVNSLPANPDAQTVYQAIDTGKYWRTDKVSDCSKADYYQPKLYLSDETVEDIFDQYGNDKTVYRCMRLILPKIGDELRIVRMTSGTESTEYLALRDLYNYYKNMINDFKEEAAENVGYNTGRYLRTRSVRRHIAGGNL